MKGPFRCSDCEHMGLMGRARLTSFIAFTAPGGSTPAIKTSPRWCPLKRPGATRSPGKGPSTG